MDTLLPYHYYLFHLLSRLTWKKRLPRFRLVQERRKHINLLTLLLKLLDELFLDKVELVKADACLLECLYEDSWVFADHTTDLVYDIYGLLLDDGRLFT